VGWIAGLTHAADAELLAIGVTLERLLATYGDLRVATIGLDLKLRSDRYHNLERVPFARLAHAAAAFDIGIAPLADIPFNAARSNVKVKEYAALGIPWLASPLGPYCGLGPEQGGMLVADGEWEPALMRLIEDRGARRRLGRAALKWGRSQTIERHVDRWEQAFSAAIGRARERRPRTVRA
jgi:glycosyltransferase involved in cell wall biosynthesis